MMRNSIPRQTIITSFVFAFLVLMQFSSYAQGWEKYYDAETTMSFYDINSVISPAVDGGALLFAPSDLNQPQSQVKVAKLNRDGFVQTQSYIPNTTSSSEYPVWATNTIDGGHAIVVAVQDSAIVRRFDQIGQLLWEKSYLCLSGLFGLKRIASTLDGGFIITMVNLNISSSATANVVKIDSVGNILWDLNLGTLVAFNKSIPIIIHPNNTYSIVYDEENSYINTGNIATLDANGNLLWTKTVVPSFGNCELLDASRADNGVTLLFRQENFPYDHILAKTDSIGDIIWNFKLPYPDYNPDLDGVIRNTPDGGWIIFSELVKLNQWYSGLMKLDQNGFLEWTKVFPGQSDHLDVSPDGNYYFLTSASQQIRVIKLRKDGNLYGNFILGNVAQDLNLNCAYDPNEKGLRNMLVKATGASTFYGISDSTGNYSIEVDTGSYQLNISNSPFWNSSCNIGPIQVNYEDSIDADLLLSSLFDCPYLTIDVSTPFLRRCFDNAYTVSYCNQGTVASPGTTVTLDLHPHFNVISSTIPWSNQTGNTYSFQVGNLEVGDCGSFMLIVNPNCDSTILGQTLCIGANISPDSICTPPSTSWDGSITDLDVQCGTDSLIFTIKNIGQGSMGAPQEYFVIQDNLITRQGTFQLASLDSLQIKVPANGATYRLYAGQSPGYFPAGYTPTIAYEGCGTNAIGTFSTGFINMFIESDLLNTETIECQEIIGSFDPNDKHATPKGYGSEHFIEVGDDLTYRIRFQNTGTDTAFTVVIRDTISDELDLATLIPGTSSHPYHLEIDYGNVLKFTFNNILLPDSTTNEPESHGFVKFKISQQPNLPLGTMIYNDAAIFFDFNDPIITNKTFHEIGEDFIVVSNSPSPEYPSASVSVRPNPFVHYAEFILEGVPEGRKTFELYDAQGRLVRIEAFTDDTHHRFYKEDLSTGIYFYKILLDNKLLTSGKMIAGN